MYVFNLQVDVLVTTAGGIEEDLIKCLGMVYMGDFSLPGKELFKNGIDRLDFDLSNYTMPVTWNTLKFKMA